MTDAHTPATEAGRRLLLAYRTDDYALSLVLAIEAEARGGYENRWTRQELLDIFDRTADRPAIRDKIRGIVR